MANIGWGDEREMKKKIGETLDVEAIADIVAAALRPEDVYNEDQLADWAKERGYVAKADLEDWATDNGYIKPEEEAT